MFGARWLGRRGAGGADIVGASGAMGAHRSDECPIGGVDNNSGTCSEQGLRRQIESAIYPWSRKLVLNRLCRHCPPYDALRHEWGAEGGQAFFMRFPLENPIHL